VAEKIYNALFLCTGNSARSILAEALLNHWGRGRFAGYSAGSFPKVMDFVFTVCDQAAGEICPIWPGNPVTAHWGVPDPAAAEGSEAERMAAFRDAYRRLEARTKLFVALPFDKLDRLALKREAEVIGRAAPSA
jgi:protein-tyrosine-phosphatase